jgi:dihydroxy-acid dehydratase
MGLIRLNVPSLLLYGGSIAPGHYKDRDLTIVDVYEAIGAYANGKIGAEELQAIEALACPGPGACGGQFTANTMATAVEIMGICPMGMAGVPAMDPEKDDVARRAGQLMLDLLARDLRPRQIITRQSLENAITLPLPADRPMGCCTRWLCPTDLPSPSTSKTSAGIAVIADLKPGGRFVATDMHRAGGIPLLAKPAGRRQAARRRDNGHRAHAGPGSRAGARTARPGSDPHTG